MIAYSTLNAFTIQVKVDGKVSGHIRRSESGWRYQSKGSKSFGEPNHSLDAVKRSLEN